MGYFLDLFKGKARKAVTGMSYDHKGIISTYGSVTAYLEEKYWDAARHGGTPRLIVVDKTTFSILEYEVYGNNFITMPTPRVVGMDGRWTYWKGIKLAVPAVDTDDMLLEFFY